MAHKDENVLEGAREAARFLKALANENRLLILCLLGDGEKSVTELEQALDLRQPTLSQQLARLRAGDLVTTRRDGKTIFYSLASNEAGRTLELMYDLFCSEDAIERRRRIKANARSAA